MDLNTKFGAMQMTSKTSNLMFQNNQKLKSPMVKFFSNKFLSAPTWIWTHNLLIDLIALSSKYDDYFTVIAHFEEWLNTELLKH